MKAEDDGDEIYSPAPVTGSANAIDIEEDEAHPSHAYLYVPDLSSQTGWGAHRVPERVDRKDRRPIGFRR